MRALDDLRGVLGAVSHLSHMDTLLAVDLTAIALAQRGHARHAARLFGAVDHERERTGLVVEPPDRPFRGSALHDTQSNLGHDWAGDLAEGRAMTLDEAYDYATMAASAGDGPLDPTSHTATSAISQLGRETGRFDS